MEEEKPKKERRQRRRFTDEYKAATVKLVLSGRKTAGHVARDLDLTETAVRHWLRQAQVDAGKGPAGVLTTVEKEELAKLRKEVRELRMSRRGKRYDNAAMESWFSTLKSELGERFESNAAAKEQLFD